MLALDGLEFEQGLGHLVERGAVLEDDPLRPVVLLGDDRWISSSIRRAVSSETFSVRVISRPRKTVSGLSPKAMGPSGLIPQSQTMWRAILVICLMSPAAPLEMSPMTSSSAIRPPSAHCDLR